jgi:RimJ/RimL family protein N-acetyltransferase
MAWLEPTTLRGAHVTLAPLAPDHLDGLRAAAADGELWRLWYTSVPSPDNVEKEIARRLDLQRKGSMQPFTVFDAAGAIAGMTTFMNADETNRRVEIGSTWYARRVQRTGLNTEAKLLMLTHAFERLGCIAVEFRTSWFNRESRRAIERLGAKLDGVLRNHILHANGTRRDTCVYSILDGEWPAVKANLAFLLERG